MRQSPQGSTERATRQRDAIKSVIQAAKRPLSPREVLEGARAAVRALGMATVYRNLKLLVAEGSRPGHHPARRESALRNARIARITITSNARPAAACTTFLAAPGICVVWRRADSRSSITT